MTDENRHRWPAASTLTYDRQDESAYGFLLRRKRAEDAGDHDHPLGRATRDQRIEALVWCELGEGDFESARIHLHPTRIVEAVDGQPQVPPSGLRVRRIGYDETGRRVRAPYSPAFRDEVRALLIEARDFRSQRFDRLTPDEQTVRKAMTRAQGKFWSSVFHG